MLVVAWLRAPPQIGIEDQRQLRWRRGTDDLGTDIEPVTRDELMQGFWREVGHRSREMLGAIAIDVLGHQPAMIGVAGPTKQS